MNRPRGLRIEASTACQLRCPSCPTASGAIGRSLGTGYLRFEDFRLLIEKNPWIEFVELSNWGETFLNPELVEIVRYAYEHNVTLSASNGVNLNFARPEALEAIVKYQFSALTCSIDGATQATYEKYRIRGQLAQVLAHVREINRWKQHYGSTLPLLKWQFVLFEHNYHEVDAARSLAASLEMTFSTKTSWDEALAPRDEAAARLATGLLQIRRNSLPLPQLLGSFCSQLWVAPAINVDGRVLGCCVNHWADYGNAFRDGLTQVLDGDRMERARRMLRGQAATSDDVPCARCVYYRRMTEHGMTLSDEAIEDQRVELSQRIASAQRKRTLPT